MLGSRRVCSIAIALSVAVGAGYIKAQAPRARAVAESAVTVEFDVPADLTAKALDGSPLLRAFEVGFFGSDAAPLSTIEIPRGDVSVRGTALRVRVPLAPLGDHATSAMIRIRSLAGGAASAWSEPVGPVTLPSIAEASTSQAHQTNANARAAAAAVRASRAAARSVSSADLDRRTALKESLSGLLDQGCSEADARAAFVNVQDMATAVVLVRKHGLSFPRLCSVMKGPPRVPMTHALQTLGPSLNLREELKGAKREARGLLSVRRGSQR